MKPQIVAILVILATSAFAQEAKPNFTGDWRWTICHPGSCPSAHIQQRIEQTESTVTIANTEDGVAKFSKSVYPTDGREITTHQGRYTGTNTGHWEGKILILQSTESFPAYTGPHHGPSTTQWILIMSENGQTMTTQMHNLADKNHRHDNDSTAQRVTSP
jgi:DNA gyrase/topoisomerase IV subunit A